jgi:hypothetical protein
MPVGRRGPPSRLFRSRVTTATCTPPSLPSTSTAAEASARRAPVRLRAPSESPVFPAFPVCPASISRASDDHDPAGVLSTPLTSVWNLMSSPARRPSSAFTRPWSPPRSVVSRSGGAPPGASAWRGRRPPAVHRYAWEVSALTSSDPSPDSSQSCIAAGCGRNPSGPASTGMPARSCVRTFPPSRALASRSMTHAVLREARNQLVASPLTPAPTTATVCRQSCPSPPSQRPVD